MDGGSKRGLAARTRVVRLLLATLVVAAAVVVWRHPGVCRDEVVPASGTTVEVCGPPTVTDASVAAVLALVLLLLAPDLSEGGVAGVTLKRRVEEAKADAAAARADVATVRLALTTAQHVHVANAASATAVSDGGAELLDKLWSLGYLRTPPRDAPAAAAPGDDGESLLMAVALGGIAALLPEEWGEATFVGRTRELTIVTGPDLDPPVRDALFNERGPLGQASAGHVTLARPTTALPAMAAAPVADRAGDHLGEVAVVLPRGLDLDQHAAAEGLLPVQAAFAALAAYAMQHGLT